MGLTRQRRTTPLADLFEEVASRPSLGLYFINALLTRSFFRGILPSVVPLISGISSKHLQEPAGRHCEPPKGQSRDGIAPAFRSTTSE